MSNTLINILFREAIGYDTLSRFVEPMKVNNYPPHNIVKDGDRYSLILAVAGFSREDLTVSIDKGQLNIKGDRVFTSMSPEAVMLHQGLAFREFDRSWQLGEYVEVTNVTLENGLLTVQLEQQIPEDKKARKIDIK
jgi:molecular chaperone IbpA